jgi:arylsulfatase
MQASNTPFIHGKRAVYAGGTQVPMIVSWPDGIAARGEVRTQFHHVIDIVPTVLEVTGVSHSAGARSTGALPLEGVSMAYSFAAGDAESRRREQYYEIEAQRAYRADDWKLVSWRPQDKRYDEVAWELYDLRNDFAETRDLAAQHPDRVQELEARWWAAAERYHVLPLDDRPLLQKVSGGPPGEMATRTHHAYPPGTPTLERAFQPALGGRAYEIRARIDRPTGSEEGVLAAVGSVETGWSWFVHGDRLVYVNNLPRVGAEIVSTRPLPKGSCDVAFRFTPGGGPSPLSGVGTLWIDGEPAGEALLPVPLFFTNEGLDIGRDTLTPVSRRYEAPFAFSGSFDEVVFELSPLGVPTR